MNSVCILESTAAAAQKKIILSAVFIFGVFAYSICIACRTYNDLCELSFSYFLTDCMEAHTVHKHTLKRTEHYVRLK